LKYGLATITVDSLPRGPALQVVAAAGFEWVELSCRPGHLDDWRSDPGGLRRDLEARGLRASSVHTPVAGWHNSAVGRETRLASVRAVCESLRWARDVGAGTAIVHPNAPNFEDNPDDYGVARALSAGSLAAIAEAAGRLGLRLAVENMPMVGPRRLPGVRVAEILDMIEGLGEHVGVCLDAGHSNCSGVRAAEEAAAAGRRLFTLHLQDNDGSADQHMVPGRGTVDWAALLRTLEEGGFAGASVFEVSPGAGGPEATLAALSDVRRSWGR